MQHLLLLEPKLLGTKKKKIRAKIALADIYFTIAGRCYIPQFDNYIHVIKPKTFLLTKKVTTSYKSIGDWMQNF